MRVELIAGSAWIALNIGVALMALIHMLRRERRFRLRSRRMVDAAEAYANMPPLAEREQVASRA
jgi:hypothetical protein